MPASLVRARMMRGAAAGSRFWTVVSALALARRIVKRLSGSQGEVLFSRRLEPGEVLVIASQEERVRVEGPGIGNMEV